MGQNKRKKYAAAKMKLELNVTQTKETRLSTDMVRRSSADVFPVSRARDSCAPDVDVLRGRRSTARGVLARNRTSSNTATQ